MGLDEALALFAQPKTRGRTARGPLRELGTDPDTGLAMVVKDGRFGPYVTDGTTNASLRRGDDVESLTDERAAELLAERRAAAPSSRARPSNGRPPASRGPPRRPGPARGPGPPRRPAREGRPGHRKAAASRKTAKEAAPKKASAKRAPADRAKAERAAAEQAPATEPPAEQPEAGAGPPT